MIKLIFLTFLLSSCDLNCIDESLQNELSKNASKTFATQLTNDYTDNLYDEWVANRGIVPGGDYLKGWSGNINDKYLTGYSTLNYPENGILNAGAGYLRLLTGNSNNTSINSGSFTVAYSIRKSNQTGEIMLFKSFSDPKISFYLQISSTNTHMGILYNGILYDSGFDFIYDSNFHQLVFTIDDVNNKAGIYLDGNIVGGLIDITGDQLILNPIQTINIISSNTEVKKVRIYTESLSQENISMLSDGEFSENPFIDNTPLRLVVIAGQSNVGFVPNSDFPDSIKNYQSGGLIYSINNNKPKFVSANTIGGPGLPLLYYIKTKFPGDDIRYTIHYKSNTGFSNTGANWTGTLRTQLKLYTNNSLKVLNSEQRNIVGIYFLWIQGERDATNEIWANDYYNQLSLLMAEMNDILGYSSINIISKLTTRSPSLYAATVTNAQHQFVLSDIVKNKLIDTDNLQSEYTMINGNVHYNAQGCTKIAETASTFIQ